MAFHSVDSMSCVIEVSFAAIHLDWEGLPVEDLQLMRRFFGFLDVSCDPVGETEPVCNLAWFIGTSPSFRRAVESSVAVNKA